MRSIVRKAPEAALFAGLLLSISACSSNLSRFDILGKGGGKASSGIQIVRSELADQGSGRVENTSIIGPGGHQLSRTTVGGSYARNFGVAVTGGHAVAGGLFGNPRATK